MTAKRVMVLDDAVVHHRYAALEIGMGVGVQVAGLAVGCPARMTDAPGANERLGRQQRFQVFKPSLSLANAEIAAFAQDGDACAVVSAIA
jgi:hypothetical protein